MPDISFEELLRVGKLLKQGKKATPKPTYHKEQKWRRPITQETRDYLESERGVTCENCEFRLWEHIHHIDEDPANNELDNLELLCRKCHNEKHD
jgi:5-methylcytosine-specific restriction endonuclease McrA